MNNMNFYNRNEVYDATLEYFKGDTLAAGVWVDKYALKDTVDGETVFYEKTTWHLNCSDIHETISLIVGM